MENDTPLPKKDEVEPETQIKTRFDWRAKHTHRIQQMEKQSVKMQIPKFPGRYTAQTWSRNWTP
jgi:hypothetical protein